MILLNNTKTGYTIKLDKDSYNTFQNIDALADGDDIDEILNMGFIIDADADEFSEIYFNHICTKYDKSVLNITIQTTNQCNFACPYCYQQHIPKVFDETNQEALIKFIKGQIENKVREIRIHWFGGEPTLNMNTIFAVEQKLNLIKSEYRNVEISNYMTSNGYLLDLEMFKRIDKYTNIKDIQITIDGIEDIHNQTMGNCCNGTVQGSTSN